MKTKADKAEESSLTRKDNHGQALVKIALDHPNVISKCAAQNGGLGVTRPIGGVRHIVLPAVVCVSLEKLYVAGSDWARVSSFVSMPEA